VATVTGGVTEFSVVLGGGKTKALEGPVQRYGRTTGALATRSAFNRRSYGLLAKETSDEADTYTFVAASTGPAATPGVISGAYGVTEFFGHTGEQWFDKFHVYPGGTTLNPTYDEGYKIEFGDILADIDREYEVYWAGRRATATLSTITLSAVSPGIETPEIVVSRMLGPGTSMLAAASTVNTDGVTGLGTPVRVNVRALQDGLSNFDGPVSFTFDTGSTTFDISGSRVAMILSNYDFPFSESMSFLTDIIPATAGKEQRIALRKQPRERYNCTFRLNGTERQRMRTLLFAWHNQTFGLPLFHEGVELTAASAIGAFQFQITGGDSTDFRIGGLGVVYDDPFTFDVVEISAVTDTLVTIAGTAQNAYPVGTRIVPVRTCRIVSQVATKMWKYGDMEEFDIVFESTDNDTGTPAADTTLWGNMSTYNGKLLLDDCNVMGLSMRTVMDRNIIVLDNETGAVTQQSAWDFDKRQSSKGFVTDSKEATQDLKALLRGIRGKQVSFYLPTFTNDLTMGASSLSGSTNFDIENIDYGRFAEAAGPMSIFKITYTDDTSLIRIIQSAAEHPTDPTLERLTLDTTWPTNRAVSEVVRIEFYELVRFDTDRFVLKHDRVGRARMTAPVKVVFD